MDHHREKRVSPYWIQHEFYAEGVEKSQIQQHHHLFNTKQLNNLIMTQQKHMLNDAQYILINFHHRLKLTSFWNYTAKLTMASEFLLMHSWQIRIRFSVEHSFSVKVNNIMYIANCHFVAVDEEDNDARWEFKEVPLDITMFYDLMVPLLFLSS